MRLSLLQKSVEKERLFLFGRLHGCAGFGFLSFDVAFQTCAFLKLVVLLTHFVLLLLYFYYEKYGQSNSMYYNTKSKDFKL